MLELIFIACTIVSGARCQDHSMTFEQPEGMLVAYGCGLTGQAELAKWREEHPNWWIAGWHCGAPRSYAKI